MQSHTTHAREPNSLLGLVTGLREDVRTLFHEEVQLAKKEVSEKVSHFSRNSIYLGIGGVICYLAGMFLLLALSLLLGFAYEALGLSTAVGLFLGFLTVAVLCGVVGGILVVKALSALKKESLMPEKTLETLREIKGGGLEQAPVSIRTAPEPKDTRSSDEIRSEVERTRSRIGREVRGLRTQLQFATMAIALVERFRRNPLRSLGISLGTGLAAFALARGPKLLARRRTA